MDKEQGDLHTGIAAVGFAWYRRDEYPDILKIMADADKLYPRYDDWLQAAENGERNMKANGHVVVRAEIRPDEFVAWCRTKGLQVDANARTTWGNEKVHEAVLKARGQK